jgi:hypothetical protein
VKAARWTGTWPAVVLTAVFVICLAVQVLLPGFIGIANNGDFGKVYAWLCLAPRGAETTYVYFQPDFVWSARNYWNSPYHSSESALAWLATRFAGATHEGARFDLRWLAAIHVALCVAAFAVLLTGLRAMSRPLVFAILPLVIFADVCYAAYLNSFYMDAAALCALLLMTAAAVWMMAPPMPRAAPVAVFALAAIVFVTSKAQHAVWGFLPVVMLLACGFRWRQCRALAWSAAALVLLADAAMLGSIDASYRGQAMFNVLFDRLGPAGVDLQPLGVRPEEVAYRGMNAYTPGAPAANRAWTEEFGRRTGFVRLAGWYARHPASTFGFLRETLKNGAPEMRPVNLSNFRVEDGRPPGARTGRFALWSNLRSRLVRRWPWHIAVWYAVFLVGCAASRSPLKWVVAGIAALGMGEFVAAALGDSLDAARHLFLFHAATDLTICFGVAWVLQKTIRQTP